MLLCLGGFAASSVRVCNDSLKISPIPFVECENPIIGAIMLPHRHLKPLQFNLAINDILMKFDDKRVFHINNIYYVLLKAFRAADAAMQDSQGICAGWVIRVRGTAFLRKRGH